MHPDITQEIALMREYVAAMEAEVNGWQLIPRIPARFPFYSISLEAVSKAFALSDACLVLLESAFPDEAFGLARSLVECALNLRFLTEDPERLFERSLKFVRFSEADMQLWLHYTLERK